MWRAALSLGERVSRNGAFTSRRGTGEGLPARTLSALLDRRNVPSRYAVPMRTPTPRVRELRRKQTEAEEAAWYLLRGRELGAKFRRQCRIEDWVVDFYCFEHRLAIELDGGIHSQPSQMQKDATKEDYLRNLGIALLRIPNGLVLGDPEEFVRKVRQAIKSRTSVGAKLTN